MKYLKSTTQKAYTVNGKVIPACMTPGNKTLVVDDSEWFQISAQPVIASLIKAGDILVMDEDPNVREDTEARNQVAELKAQNTLLTEKLKQLEQQSGRKSTEAGDAELQALAKKNEELTKTNEELTKANEKLVTEMREFKEQAIKELGELKTENDKLQAKLTDTSTEE